RLTVPVVETETTLAFELTVSDGESIASDTMKVEVIAGAAAPTIQASPTEGPAPLKVTFTANTLHEGTLSDEAFTWDFGDGEVGTGRQVTHIYARAAVYTATACLTLPIGGPD